MIVNFSCKPIYIVQMLRYKGEDSSDVWKFMVTKMIRLQHSLLSTWSIYRSLENHSSLQDVTCWPLKVEASEFCHQYPPFILKCNIVSLVLQYTVPISHWCLVSWVSFPLLEKCSDEIGAVTLITESLCDYIVFPAQSTMFWHWKSAQW